MKYIFVPYLFASICQVIFAEVTCPLPCNSTLTPSFVEDFCVEQNATMVGRCCFSANSRNQTIIGVDLRSCGILKLNITSIASQNIKIMDLRNNTLNNLTIFETEGMINLNDLYLPYDNDCPGDDIAWNSTKLHTKNITDSYMQCHIQENPCVYLNVSCTINGICLHEGPGYAKCSCKPGNYGYKCMKSGVFPATLFSVSLICCTVLVSAFSWFYIRKHAMGPQKSD